MLADAKGGKVGEDSGEDNMGVKWEDYGFYTIVPTQTTLFILGHWGEHESDCSGGLFLGV